MTKCDVYKMTLDELWECGCDRCLDAMKLHGELDRLIASQDKTVEALDRLEASVASLERSLA